MSFSFKVKLALAVFCVSSVALIILVASLCAGNVLPAGKFCSFSRRMANATISTLGNSNSTLGELGATLADVVIKEAEESADGELDAAERKALRKHLRRNNVKEKIQLWCSGAHSFKFSRESSNMEP